MPSNPPPTTRYSINGLDLGVFAESLSDKALAAFSGALNAEMIARLSDDFQSWQDQFERLMAEDEQLFTEGAELGEDAKEALGIA